MATSDASFDDYEERWAQYWAHGSSAVKKLPGMSPGVAAGLGFTAVHLLKSDCRAALIKPNTFNSIQAAYLPTAGEYESYAAVAPARTTAGWTVAASGGGFRISNAADILFPVAGGASTGCTLTHAIFCLLKWNLGGILYGIFVTDLTTPLVVAVGTQPRFLAGTLTFNCK